METAITTIEPSALEALGVWQWTRPLNVETGADFHRMAIDAMGLGKSGPLLLDLSQASHIDACGLQILLTLAIEALNRGRVFEIVKASYAIQRDLQLSGVAYLMRQE